MDTSDTTHIEATSSDTVVEEHQKNVQGLKLKKQKLKILETDLKIKEKEIQESIKHRPKLESHI